MILWSRDEKGEETSIVAPFPLVGTCASLRRSFPLVSHRRPWLDLVTSHILPRCRPVATLTFLIYRYLRQRRTVSATMSKKRKSHPKSTDSTEQENVQAGTETTTTSNPLLTQQTAFLESLSKTERNDYFSPTLDPSRRAELWMQQADLGERLVNSYSWATPDQRAIRILRHFSPIVEIAAGQGYWLQMMKDNGIDAVGYDVDLEQGGKIAKATPGRRNNNNQVRVKQGGPSVLSRQENSKRTLFLCYPDEEVGDSESDSMGSLSSACLVHYTGDYIIHVGELFVDSTLSMDQAPWGRSTSPEFQEQLAAQFHCVLKVSLPSWLHVRDTLSVWKRSQICSILFEAEEDDEEGDEEFEYR
jgi:hypothetical protein